MNGGLTQRVRPFSFIDRDMFGTNFKYILEKKGFSMKAVVWFATVFLCLIADWWFMKMGLDIEYPNTFGTIIKSVGDVSLILSPFWLLSPKWRWSAIIPVWIFPIWCICNLAYFRFWNDLIPPAAVTMGGNVDGNLVEYGLALLRWEDILFMIPPIFASIVLWYVKPSESPSFRTGIKWSLFGVSLLIGLAGQASYFKTTFSWRNHISQRSFSEGLSDHFKGGYTGQKQLYLYNGPAYYCARFAVDAIKILTSSVTLTDEQTKDISDFLHKYERAGIQIVDSISGVGSTNGCAIDSMNVVFIIVESLNADMVGKKIEGWDVMPTLDSLARTDGTVVFDNVVSQIKASSSSDGHLLLMTGLLPPDKIAYSITYGSKNTFPSLADVLPNHNKYLLLADEGVCWNEGNTLKNFGLGEPLAIKDRPEFPIDKYGRDGAMFLQAIATVKKAKQPFFMTLMTISMHIPFTESAWPLPDNLKKAKGLTKSEKDYANMCHNTDWYIGKFVKCLPQNTLVIIASDHHQTIASEEGSARAFYMAVNCGRTETISRTVGQVNLFPATLEILGYKMPYPYRGLAPSAFNPCVDGTVDSYGNVYGNPSSESLDTLSKAYRISDLIIRGDYFENRKSSHNIGE